MLIVLRERHQVLRMSADYVMYCEYHEEHVTIAHLKFNRNWELISMSDCISQNSTVDVFRALRTRYLATWTLAAAVYWKASVCDVQLSAVCRWTLLMPLSTQPLVPIKLTSTSVVKMVISSQTTSIGSSFGVKRTRHGLHSRVSVQVIHFRFIYSICHGKKIVH